MGWEFCLHLPGNLSTGKWVLSELWGLLSRPCVTAHLSPPSGKDVGRLEEPLGGCPHAPGREGRTGVGRRHPGQAVSSPLPLHVWVTQLRSEDPGSPPRRGRICSPVFTAPTVGSGWCILEFFFFPLKMLCAQKRE